MRAIFSPEDGAPFSQLLFLCGKGAAVFSGLEVSSGPVSQGIHYNRYIMDEIRSSEMLRREGFSHTYIWQDGPNVTYPNHTHPSETAHIILSGEMTLTMDGEARTYRSGDRCDVPAGAVHSARMGPTGCRYLIGERS
jgi:mannose-6-phosphate isomerase-like protein (cupin superfamily)